jgi:hypothetical protein
MVTAGDDVTVTGEVTEFFFGGGSTSTDVTTVSSFLPHLRALDFDLIASSATHQRRLRRPDQRPRPAAGLHQPAALGLAP